MTKVTKITEFPVTVFLHSHFKSYQSTQIQFSSKRAQRKWFPHKSKIKTDLSLLFFLLLFLPPSITFPCRPFLRMKLGEEGVTETFQMSFITSFNPWEERFHSRWSSKGVSWLFLAIKDRKRLHFKIQQQLNSFKHLPRAGLSIGDLGIWVWIPGGPQRFLQPLSVLHVLSVTREPVRMQVPGPPTGESPSLCLGGAQGCIW